MKSILTTIAILISLSCFIGCEGSSSVSPKYSNEDWQQVGIAQGYTMAAQKLDSLFNLYHSNGSEYLRSNNRDSAIMEQGRMKVCLDMSIYFAKQSQSILNKYKQ